MIKLIIGLGNPDKKYANTYHNAGFLFIDFVLRSPKKYQSTKEISVSQFRLPAGRQVENSYFVKSEVYMNESGRFVAAELKKRGLKSEEFLIVHDDSDIELGRYKFSFGSGSAGHHGVSSIQQTLKTKNFWRLRIGIRDFPKPREKTKIIPGSRLEKNLELTRLKRVKAKDLVLKKISAPDRKKLEKIFAAAAKEFETRLIAHNSR